MVACHGLLAVMMSAAILTAADVPRKAQDLKVALPNGQLIGPSQYKGKVVLIVFILTT